MYNKEFEEWWNKEYKYISDRVLLVFDVKSIAYAAWCEGKHMRE